LTGFSTPVSLAPIFATHPPNLDPLRISSSTIFREENEKTANMVQENIVIAIIIIVLFVVIALISFGIYRLIHAARGAPSSSSSGSNSLVDD